MEQTYDHSIPNYFGNDIPACGEVMPEDDPTLPIRTGKGAFRPGDHVRSVASGGKPERRLFGVIDVNQDGSLHLWAHKSGHIWNAEPEHWERTLRNEELPCAA